MPGLDVTGSGGVGGRLRVTPGGGISGIVRTSNATMRVCASLTRSFAAPSRALASSFSRSRWARSCVRWLARVSSSSLSRSDSSSACLRRSRSLAAMASVLWANPRRTPWKAVDGGVSGVSRGGFAASKIYRLSAAARSVPTKNVHHITPHSSAQATRRHRLSVTCKPRICTRAFRDGRHRASRTHTIAARVGRTRRRRQLRRPRIRTRRQPANRSSSSEPVGVDSPPPSHCARLDAR